MTRPRFDFQSEYHCSKTIKSQLQAKGGTAADFSSLTAADQQGMLRRALDTLSGTAKAKRSAHAAPFRKIAGEHTRKQDAMATNPNWKPNDPQWGKNCQRCVSAYEARLRGYDVTALPRITDGSDRLQYMHDPKGWPQAYKDPDLIKCASNSGVGTMGKVEARMAAWGDGARAIVRVQWQDKYGGGGHVFIAEQVNGRTMFIDPQSGTMDCSSHFALVKKSQTFVMRVDDREFTDLVFECCEEARKRAQCLKRRNGTATRPPSASASGAVWMPTYSASPATMCQTAASPP